jgi:hypothetical protein
MNETITVHKVYTDLLDQVFEIEKKLEKISEPNSIVRNINRMKELFENLYADSGLVYQNPMGEPYSETRTDLEASIAGSSVENLVVTEVIKPIIRLRYYSGATTIVRKGVVVVESKS